MLPVLILDTLMVPTQPLDEENHWKFPSINCSFLQILGLCCQSLYWILLWCLLSPWMK